MTNNRKVIEKIKSMLNDSDVDGFAVHSLGRYKYYDAYEAYIPNAHTGFPIVFLCEGEKINEEINGFESLDVIAEIRKIRSQRRELLKFCRYYDGTEECNFNDSQLWTLCAIERMWVEFTLEGRDELFSSAISDWEAYGLIDFCKDDGVPISLKAFLFNRAMQYDERVDVEAFKESYKNIYLSRPTNLEKRANDRTKELIARCKYYQGERTNPWKYCYNPTLVWRRNIWELEKTWVKTLSNSYATSLSKHEILTKFGLVEDVRAKGLPASLINLVIKSNQDNQLNQNNRFCKEEVLNLIDKYVKFAPLGFGPEKYFAYFMGEEDCPFGDRTETDLSGLFWLQERIIYGNIQTDKKFIKRFEKDLNQYKLTKEELEDRELMNSSYGWLHDKKYPLEQRAIWLFCGANIGIWCPYDDINAEGDEYINFKYVYNPIKDKHHPTRSELISLCKYYKGEESVPHKTNETPKHFNLYWGEEKIWVKLCMEDPTGYLDFENAGINDYGWSVDNKDGVVLSFKVWFYFRYLNAADALGMPQNEEGFRKFYLDGYINESSK